MKGSEGLSMEEQGGLEEGCICWKDRELTTQQKCIPWLDSSDGHSSFWPHSAFHIISKPWGSHATVREVQTGCGVIARGVHYIFGLLESIPISLFQDPLAPLAHLRQVPGWWAQGPTDRCQP